MSFKILLKWFFVLIPLATTLYVIGYIWIVRTHYNYDVKLDYDYGNIGDTIIKTRIVDGTIFLDVDSNWETGFVKLNVEASLLGQFFNPKIYTGIEVHVFERGAKGNRFINISNNLLENNPVIKIDFEYCNLADLSCEVILFNNEPLNNKRILVISPHPDDAEIAAYGLYSNHESFIVTITTGDFGPKSYNEIVENDSVHYLLKGRLRFWNSITIPMLGGVELKNIANLGYSDLTLEELYENKDSLISSHLTGLTNINYYRKNNFRESMIPPSDGRPIWSNLVDDLAHIITYFNPDVIVLPHVLLEHHSDHTYSSIAVFEAVKKTGKQTGQFYFYTNHLSGGVGVWPFGTMGDAIDLPPNLCKLDGSLRIHSVQLTSEDQIEKTMALEAMNDLRLDLEWLWVKGTWLKFRYRTMKEIMGHEDNYFFRAVRSNELFFVEDIKVSMSKFSSNSFD